MSGCNKDNEWMCKHNLLESNILYGYTEQGVLKLLVPVVYGEILLQSLKRDIRRLQKIWEHQCGGSECQIQTSVSHQCESLIVMDSD